MQDSSNIKAWLVTANMGYGHRRTIYPLRHLAFDGKIINVNNYDGIPENDLRIWKISAGFYEFVSRFKKFPILGSLIFSAFNQFQKIPDFHPERDLSGSNFQLWLIFYLLKKNWGRDLIFRLSSARTGTPPPIVTSYFVPSFMAEFFNYSGEIFCILCDADIGRFWVPPKARESKIKYFAPSQRVADRLRLYGVRPENIFLTGFPLPLENIGGRDMAILKEDFSRRLLNLDPHSPQKSDRPLTVMFSLGGAGAQKEIGSQILKSLSKKIMAGQVKVILAIGARPEIKEYFEQNIKELNLKEGAEIIFDAVVENYFDKFNRVLRKTDILWTKPSELSFYAALGLPIIFSPPVGSHEDYNKKWLLDFGFGIAQGNPKDTNQWLFDLWEQGYFARCAQNGFAKGEKLGTFNIEEILSKCSGS